MWRLTERTVRSGLVIAWRFATSPTRTSPVFEKPTTDGVVRAPSALGITVGSPASRTETTELVVPRSMPTALGMRVCLRELENRWLAFNLAKLSASLSRSGVTPTFPFSAPGFGQRQRAIACWRCPNGSPQQLGGLLGRELAGLDLAEDVGPDRPGAGAGLRCGAEGDHDLLEPVAGRVVGDAEVGGEALEV